MDNSAAPDAGSLGRYYEQTMPFATVEIGGRSARYGAPTRQALWRAQSLETKEPETLAWIAGFAPGDSLIDIGANVGMYTIWAAATAGVRVFAFEPEAQNYALLNHNIRLNGLDALVRAYCLAIADATRLGDLFLSDLPAGASHHTFGASIDNNLQPMQARFAQGAVSFSLDELVALGTIPVPTHLKIDVDGLEHHVIRGARGTLNDPQLKSVLIELNADLAEHRNLVPELTGIGFALDVAQVYAASRRGDGFKSTSNYIFRR